MKHGHFFFGLEYFEYAAALDRLFNKAYLQTQTVANRLLKVLTTLIRI